MTDTISRDGTRIALERIGHGPAVVLVMGAFNDRKTGAPLAARLATRFTVWSYDRRGRGDSADATEYAVAREIEDLEAVIQRAGGAASVFGYSSGAALALRAAAHGASFTHIALYETPPAQPPIHAAELASRVASGRRGDAVEYFQLRMVGLPEHVVAELGHAPFRPALEAMAPTLPYEAKILSDLPPFLDLAADVQVPALAIAGGASPSALRDVTETLGRTLPNGSSVVLDGLGHDLVVDAIAPVLERFFEA